MKMVKSLLLGSAAGLVAVAGAQAADLPVKAKPVQYVKICTLYGDGFYYIPGSDTCIRFGGYIRADYNCNGRTPHVLGATGAQDRTVSRWTTRHRANLTTDARTQTAYGTLRAYTSINAEVAEGTATLGTHRAFIQWGGFTFGRTVVVRRPRRQPGRQRHAVALHRTGRQHDRRRRHQPDRLYVAARQRHHLERRRRRSACRLDRQSCRVLLSTASRSAPIRPAPGKAPRSPIRGLRCGSARPGAAPASR